MPSVETVEAPTLPKPTNRGFERALADAERLGRLEAEAFESALREAERRERENLMGRTAMASGLFAGSDPDEAPTVTNTEVLRLRREIDRFAEFHRSLLHSRSWRLLQALKRPLGRAW